MASAPQQPTLPLFYNDLMPLNSRDHGKWRTKSLESADFLKSQHAIPLTVDEFAQAQRNFPIVFSSGESPLPLALMGMNEGINTFVDDAGKITEEVYVPAYVRRYPFMLAKLRQDAEELSLCFDPTSEVLGDFKKGEPLFNDKGEASENTQRILEFCQHFEEAGQRTRMFLEELAKHNLLMDGEIAITQNDNPDKPFVYRGFRMIDQEKLREIKAETLAEWNKNGMLAIIYSHLMSLELMRNIFARQMRQGKVPQPDAAIPETTEAN
jgi:hypothetical protein